MIFHLIVFSDISTQRIWYMAYHYLVSISRQGLNLYWILTQYESCNIRLFDLKIGKVVRIAPPPFFFLGDPQTSQRGK